MIREENIRILEELLKVKGKLLERLADILKQKAENPSEDFEGVIEETEKDLFAINGQIHILSDMLGPPAWQGIELCECTDSAFILIKEPDNLHNSAVIVLDAKEKYCKNIEKGKVYVPFARPVDNSKLGENTNE